MYNFSLDVKNRKIEVLDLRSNEKNILKTESKIGIKNQHSPYYIGTLFLE